MRRTEGIVHVDIGERRQRARELRIVLLLALVEADVLEHQDFARLQLARRGLGLGADAGVDRANRRAEQLRQMGSHRGVAQVLGNLPAGAAAVGADHDAGAVVAQVLDGRQ